MLAFIGNCLFVLAWAFMTLGVFFRFTPALLVAAQRILRTILVLSFRLYFLILDASAPAAQELLGIDLLGPWPRLLFSLGMSTLLTSLFWILISGRVTVWTFVLGLTHGLLVGLAWREIAFPGSLQLGVRRE